MVGTAFVVNLERISDLRSRGRWPLLIVVGAVCFVVGLAFHPGTRARITGKLTYEANPHIPEAVRVRVLNGLLEERYPVTYVHLSF